MESLWEWGSHFRESFAVFLDLCPVHGQLVWLVWFYRTGSKIHNNYPIHYMRCTVVPCLKIKTTLAPEYVSYPKPSLIFCHMTVGYSWVTYGIWSHSQFTNITTWATPRRMWRILIITSALPRIWVLSRKTCFTFIVTAWLIGILISWLINI